MVFPAWEPETTPAAWDRAWGLYNLILPEWVGIYRIAKLFYRTFFLFRRVMTIMCPGMVPPPLRAGIMAYDRGMGRNARLARDAPVGPCAPPPCVTGGRRATPRVSFTATGY
ncbi:hypothetical protein Geu3261_0160_058 [Komagataeibacter europaeus NBRC 3261]|uniref:Uncharacterized protein n=1 Tax=Komagataeibacter europaeus NBRC 3261 TaxID=1234669 RepID=A0A0D6Q216_KOMEU|nr:hypothetical protein Geu3261_0160_058 [Komagataeibacter europaeus NBRC 3261]